MIEPLLLSTSRILTFKGETRLTNASSFFFEIHKRLFLVTSRHVLFDEPTNHFPDRIEIELHTDRNNMAKSVQVSLPLYRQGKSLWRQGLDTAGEIDVAVLHIKRDQMPKNAVFHAFTDRHLLSPTEQVEVGSSLLLVGYPLDFHDTLHHMPVTRHAIIASSFGLRFQGNGYFLTDSRTHRGVSGAPLVMRAPNPDLLESDLQWVLLGVHSARLDVGTRDMNLDEVLGLNCAWYADILLTLTKN